MNNFIINFTDGTSKSVSSYTPSIAAQDGVKNNKGKTISSIDQGTNTYVYRANGWEIA